MASMPWVKFYIDFLDDPKIGRLTDRQKLRFVQLILIAGECDMDGLLVNGETALNTEDIAWRIRSDPKDVLKDLEALHDAGLVNHGGEAITVVNFSKRQGRSQEDKRAQWRDSKRRSRVSPTGVQQESNENPVGVQPLEERREEKRREEKEEEGATSAPTPAKPAPASVSSKTQETEKPARPRDLLFDAIADVTHSNPALMGSRIAKCAKDLRKVDATPAQVHQVAAWYLANDWRGQRGDKLTFTSLVEVWDAGVKGLKIAQRPGANGRKKGLDASTDAVLEAMQDPRWKEVEDKHNG